MTVRARATVTESENDSRYPHMPTQRYMHTYTHTRMHTHTERHTLDALDLQDWTQPLVAAGRAQFCEQWASYQRWHYINDGSMHHVSVSLCKSVCMSVSACVSMNLPRALIAAISCTREVFHVAP